MLDLNVMEAMGKAQALLDRSGVTASQLEAGMLLAHLLDCPRTRLYIDRDRDLTPAEIRAYFGLVDKRVRGTPIHYIIGHREFMGLDFCVEEGVLIPRPDTEVLVEHIIERVKTMDNYVPSIIDIGTGSGAIAVSLAKYIDGSRVTAVDIDSGALGLAQRNADAYGLTDRIDFLWGDVFELFKGPGTGGQGPGFDVMVSNPPYIPTRDIEGLEPQVRDHEPRIALDGGEDGLDFYRGLAGLAPNILNNGGLLAVEVGYDQACPVAHILKAVGCYGDISFVKDLSGYKRVVAAIFRSPAICPNLHP